MIFTLGQVGHGLELNTRGSQLVKPVDLASKNMDLRGLEIKGLGCNCQFGREMERFCIIGLTYYSISTK